MDYNTFYPKEDRVLTSKRLISNDKKMSKFVLEEFAVRLQELIADFGNVSQLSKATDYPQPTIDYWSKGHRRPYFSNVERLCEPINVNPMWLYFGEGSKYITDSPPTPLENFKRAMEQFGADWESADTSVVEAASAYVRDVLHLDLSFVKPTVPDARPPSSDFGYVPKSEAVLSAGGGAFPVSEETEAYYAFRMEWLMSEATSISNLILTEIQGDSMSPRINHGDTILIDRGRTKLTKKPHVFAFRDDATLHVKWLKKAGKKIIAISENAEYPPFEVDPEHMQIFGQVIGAWISFT